MNTTTNLRTLLPLIVISAIAGCSSPMTEVSGNVRFKGRPLPDGFITFFPHGQPGNAQGTEVKSGRYRLSGIATGKMRVLVTSAPPIRIVKDDRGADKLHLVPFQPVPPEGVGNNVVLDLIDGSNTVDLDLK